MGNNTTESKLDNTIKDTLNNYEAKHDAGDWSRMERMLDAAPKSGSASWNYRLTSIIIGIAVIGGGYLIYKGTRSKSTIDQATETPAAPNQTQSTITPPPETSTAPAVKEAPAPAVTPSQNALTPAEKITTAPKTTPDPKVENGLTVTEKTKKEKKKKEDDDSTGTKHQKVSVMGNEPVFGDMIDSSKGIIHETKEKESVKKAAKSKGTSKIGLSGLLNINADSIRKYSEQMKKDTVK